MNAELAECNTCAHVAKDIGERLLSEISANMITVGNLSHDILDQIVSADVLTYSGSDRSPICKACTSVCHPCLLVHLSPICDRCKGMVECCSSKKYWVCYFAITALTRFRALFCLKELVQSLEYSDYKAVSDTLLRAVAPTPVVSTPAIKRQRKEDLDLE
jgi:hypothetical protein